MLGPVRLDDRAARQGAAPGPAHGLGQELVRPLRGALVGQVERDVGRHDADQRDLGHVEPLGDEAGPDEHVRPPGGERVEHPLRRALALGDVAVQPGHAQVGEAVAHLALDALRPAAEVPDPRRRARRAARRDRPGAPAVVAAERRPGLVVDERPFAVRAGLDGPAVAAQHDRRRPAPVHDEDRPLAGGRVQGPQRVDEHPGQQPAIARGQLRAEVDGDHDGLRAARARREDRAPVPAGSGVAHRLHRRRRGSEDDRRAGQPPQLERGVARLEARRAVALVGRVVLLVHDDQADVGERREQRRPGAHHEVDVARPDPAPLVGALALAEARVDQGDPDRELGAQPVDDGRGEGDLRDEQERRAAGLERGGDGLDVDRGLAAARDAVEQDRRRVARRHGVQQQPEGGGLVGGQGGPGGTGAAHRGRAARERASRALAHLDAQQPAPDEAGEGRGSVALRQRGGGDPVGRSARAVVRRQLRERRLLARSQRATRGLVPARERRRGGGPLVRQPHAPLVARPDGRPEQRPGQLQEAPVGERAEAAQEPRPPVGRRQVAHGARPPGELVEQVDVRGVERVTAERRLAGRRDLRHQLQALEHARREHRPDHHRQRREVAVGEHAGEGQRERRQERPVAADPRRDVAQLAAGRRRRGAGHHPDRLPAALAERHQHGLARLEVAERRRHAVGEGARPGAGRGVDRDLDEHGVRSGGRVGRRGAGGRAVAGGLVAGREAEGVGHRPISRCGSAGPRCVASPGR